MTLPVNERIREFRTAKKMTQTSLAAMIGVSPNTLSEYESGKYNPSPEIIAKINKLGGNIHPPFFVLLRQKITAAILLLAIPILQQNKQNLKSRLSSSSSKQKSPEECWIRYQLTLRNIRLEIIANKTNCTVATVSRVISRNRHSEKVEIALAQMLGYPSWEQLWADAVINAKGGAA